MSTNTLVQTELDFSFIPDPIQQHEQLNEKQKHTRTDKAIQAWANQVKSYELTNANQKYMEAFRKAKYPNYETNPKHKASWAQYKCSIGMLLDSLDKDAVTITQDDINNFLSPIVNLNTKANREAHIKSLLSFILNKNISFCRQRSNSFVLVFADIVPEWFLNDKNIVKRLTAAQEE